MTLPTKITFEELSRLIEKSQHQLVSYANSSLTLLFWRIGKRINEEVLQNKCAEYAKNIVSTVSTQLKAKYGRNFEQRQDSFDFYQKSKGLFCGALRAYKVLLESKSNLPI